MKKIFWITCVVTLILPVFSVSSNQGGFFNEAPMLTERVEAGTLPAVDDRIPSNPMILQPVDEVGQYGGTLTVPVTSLAASTGLLNLAGYEPLMRWDTQWLRVLPNIAQSVDTNDEATIYTFHLRSGMRWSDGTPFTSTDIMFWYEAVFSNAELTPRPPNWLSTDGVPVVVSAPDDMTVIFEFAQPNGFFLYELANNLGTAPTRYPRHYYEQFHPDYNSEIDELIAEGEFEDWTALFESKTESGNMDKPVLGAWLLIENGETLIAERNPYYWKIDSNFNQLPYIDYLEFVEVSDEASLTEAVDNADASMIFDDTLADFVADDMTEITLISSYSTAMVIGLNLTHPDPVIRETFQNKDVRIALSHAIDRQRIVDEVFDGESEPYQVAPRPESPYFNETMAYQYTEYDVDLANQMLDFAGYDQRDADGYRLNPDGEPIVFSFQTNTASDESLDILQIIIENWQDVGINVSLEEYPPEATQDYYNLLFAGMHYTYTSEGVGGLNEILEPAYYFPVHQYASWYASGWGQWYTDPTSPLAVEPPPGVKRQMELYSQLRNTLDPDEQAQLMTEILEIAADEFLVMGTVTDANSYIRISDSLHNVPPTMPSAFAYPAPAPSNPAQYFID